MREKLSELIQTASYTCPDGIHKCPDCEYYEKDAFGNPCNDVKMVADYLIANDVVPVVRCKDCKHYMTIHCTCDGCCISDDWYCADGERKDK